MPKIKVNIVQSIQQNRGLAFHYPNFTWFLIGSFLSRTGDWFDRMALNWFVFTITKSPFSLGLVEFVQFIPVLFFSMISGVIADKWERRKVLLATQIGALIFTVAIALLMFSDLYSFPVLLVLLALRGVFLAIEIPARNAMVPNLVPKEAMTSAVSFFSATLNTSRIVGPAIAGFMLASWTAPSLLLINAASFLAVIGTLLMIRSADEQNQPKGDIKLVEGLKEAFVYLKSQSLVLGVFILGLVPMIFANPYTTLLPVFADQLLHVGSEGFGMLMSACAFGSVVCTFAMGWGKFPLSKGRLLVSYICLFGGGLMVFAISESYYWSLVLMFIVGVASMGFRIVERMIIQETIPDHMRGRILSILMMDTGLVPIGNILFGFFGEHAGPVFTLWAMGFVCIVTTIAVLFRNKQILQIR